MNYLFYVCTATIAATLLCGQAHATTGNQNTQTRTSASERVSMMTLLMPALEEVASADSTHHTAAYGCFNLLTKPVVSLAREAPVQRNGLLVDAEANAILSERAGKVLGCATGLSYHIEDVFYQMERSRPTREVAIQMLKTHLNKTFEADYSYFRDKNQAVYDIPVFVAAGNNGFSNPYIAYNDRVLQNDRNSGGHDGKGWSVHYKTLIDGGENAAREKASLIREIVYGGIYSWSTNPTQIATLCPDEVAVEQKPAQVNKTPAKPAKKPAKAAKASKVVTAPVEVPAFVPPAKHECTETYTAKFDGANLEIRRNGQPWYTSDLIGGATFAIELSGETSTGTSFKVKVK